MQEMRNSQLVLDPTSHVDSKNLKARSSPCLAVNTPLATAIKSPTPVADKNLVASRRSTCRHDRTRAKMVTPTYTVVLLQIAIMLEPRAKPASPPVFNHKTRAKASLSQPSRSVHVRTCRHRGWKRNLIASACRCIAKAHLPLDHNIQCCK